jgi:hypothetical protein
MLVDLPSNVLHHVVDCVDEPGNVAALAGTCTQTRFLAEERLSKARNAWNDLLSRAGRPLSSSSKSEDFGNKLDDMLCRFALSSAQTIDFAGLDPAERKWLHMRAGSVGIKSRTHRRKKQLGTLKLTKPQGWILPKDPLPVVTPAQKAAQAEAARMASWTTECNGCSRVLDAYGALYHYSGMGPMCEDCIEADDELTGLKWEAKADFW